MANMEFLYENYCNTTTQFSGDINTSGVSNLFDRDRSTLYETSGYSSDTAATIYFSTDTAFTVDRIAITNHNFKKYKIFYNSLTTNTFALTNYNTSASAFETNSDTSTYLIVPSTAVTSIGLKLEEAQTADTEKSMGQLYVGRSYVTFPFNPSANDYKPSIKEKNVIHKMSDGGKVRYHLNDNFNAKIKFTFISNSERTLFKTVYDSFNPFIFIPYPAYSEWDGDWYAVNWTNGFDFLKLQSNIIGNGFKGNISIEEIPK